MIRQENSNFYSQKYVCLQGTLVLALNSSKVPPPSHSSFSNLKQLYLFLLTITEVE